MMNLCGVLNRPARARLALKAAVVAAMLVCLIGAEAADSAPRKLFGINVQAPLHPSDYAKMRKAGVGTLRIGIYWSAVNPQQGITDWTTYDDVVAHAARRGITIQPFLSGTPTWVARAYDHRHCTSACGPFAPSSKKALRAWQRFTHGAAQRYGPGGKFWSQNPGVPKHPIRIWQIWNEMNSRTFFRPKPDVKRYARVLEHASSGIRKATHHSTVILGGMFATPGGGTQASAIPSTEFLRKLYRRKHIKRAFAGIAIHPYAHSLKYVKRQVVDARDVLKKVHDKRTGLWISELGWASGGPRNPLNLKSKKAQARKLRSAYKLFLRNRKRWHVQETAWFAWRDNPATSAFCSFCAKSGLLTKAGKPKPAYRAYKKIAR
jgi:hypothetical protein